MKALAPIVVLCVAWVAYCLWDIAHARVARLPRWAWALITIITIPFGGVLYLLIGRAGDAGDDDGSDEGLRQPHRTQLG